uniref:Ig-like domain-containing protein n=1 Tax=Chrysemys picta bellii TaxID=8478 RepID=A0A8C3F611_CHRPI
SGGGIKKPGETLTLTCTVSGFSLTTYEVHWVCQPAGKGLEWMGGTWGNGATAYSDALKSRLTITGDTSKSQLYLQLTGLKPEDTAHYYCARDTVKQNQFTLSCLNLCLSLPRLHPETQSAAPGSVQ